MKRFISITLILVMLLALAVGCSKKKTSDGDGNEDAGGVITTIPDGLTGKDVAKLILAKERLDAQLLKNDGDIFENGSKVFRELAVTARNNLNKRASSLKATDITFRTLTPVNLATKTNKGGGKLTVNGDVYQWSDFPKSNNSYEYFENLTDNIVRSAESGADLIDDIKKNVRVVDKWVNMGDEFYLHVEENSETLYKRSRPIDGIRQIEICKRYKNSQGKDVYEMYIAYGDHQTRMTYIPGERYEITMLGKDSDGNPSADYFIAENTKGYWENYIVGKMPTHYNVSCFIMKNDICYDSFYNPKTKEIVTLKVMSADRASDIMMIQNFGNIYDIHVHLCAFDGYKNIQVSASSGEITSNPHNHGNAVVFDDGDITTLIGGRGKAVVNMSDGDVIKIGDKYVDGEVEIYDLSAEHSTDRSYGTIMLTVTGDNHDARMASLFDFFNEVGLKCKYNTAGVSASIKRAYAELEVFTKYHKWHGINVSTESGIADAIDIENDRVAAMAKMYDGVKNAEVVDINDTEAMELAIFFEKISDSNFEGATYRDMSINVSKAMLSVNDAMLFVDKEPYVVGFALMEESGEGGLIHLEMKNESKTIYNGEDKFTVKAENISLTVPELAVGKYILAAYISTVDGIRSSGYTPVTFAEVDRTQVMLEAIAVTAEKNSDNTLTLTYAERQDINVTVTAEAAVDYAALHELIATEAYRYGIPSDEPVEKVNGETYSAMTKTETAIDGGQFRMKYSLTNGDSEKVGYIYAELAIIPAAQAIEELQG